MGRLAVATCAHYACVESAMIKGRLLAEAIGGVEYHVHIPVNAKGLVACLTGADYAILGAHGRPDRLADQREDMTYPVLVTRDEVKEFPVFSNLRLLVLLACGAAGGENDENIAAELSRHIASDGLLFANRYTITGTSSYYRAKNGLQGWVAYQNGRVVIPEVALPARITMKDIWGAYLKYREGQLK